MEPDILDLASTISRSTAVLDKHAKDNGLNMFSFEPDAPPRVILESKEMNQAKTAAISACMDLIDRLQGPTGCLKPVWNGASLRVISRFNIASHVPLDGEISYQDLSKASGVHAYKLKQVIRFAIVHHRLFFEKRKGFVSHSSGSRVLATDHLARAGVGQYDEWYPSYAMTVDAIEKFPGCEPNEAGLRMSHNTTDTYFEYLGKHPDKAQQFNDSMTYYQAPTPAISPKFLASGYPWASLPSNSTVVDLGGNNGHVAKLIAATNPSLQVVVQDLPDVIRQVTASDDSTDQTAGLPIKFEPHDFFTPQKLQADVYLLRWILHDWPDHYVVRILRQLVPALKNGAKVVLNESLSPDSQSLPLSMERYIRWMDMIMLSLNNSRLRDEEEWQSLFQEADPRFGSVKCWTPQGSALAIIEVEWEGS